MGRWRVESRLAILFIRFAARRACLCARGTCLRGSVVASHGSRMRQATCRPAACARSARFGLGLGVALCLLVPSVAADEPVQLSAQRGLHAPLPTGDAAWLLLDGGQVRAEGEAIDFDTAAVQVWRAGPQWTVSLYAEHRGQNVRRLWAVDQPVEFGGGQLQRVAFAALQNDPLYQRAFGSDPEVVQPAHAGQPPVEPAAWMQPLPHRDGSQPQPPAATPRRSERQPDGVLESVPPPRAAPRTLDGAAPRAPDGAGPAQPSGRRLRAFPRSGERLQLESRPAGYGDVQITTITGGVQLLVDGMAFDGPGEGPQPADLSADRMVIWSTGGIDLMGQQPAEDRQGVEVYLEGNIVFRQGQRVIFADRMFYSVPREVAVVLDAELMAPTPDRPGLFRLGSPLIRQVAPGRYYAEDAFFTTSLLGRPTYRWQSGSVYVVDRELPAVDPLTGQPWIDAATGQPFVRRETTATSINNTLRLGEVPVLYWPYLSVDARDPNIVLNKFQTKQNNIFGTQVLLGWDMFSALGLEAPPGQQWRLNTDWLSQRGFGHGTEYHYRGAELFGTRSEHFGNLWIWGIADHGRDNLGAGRTSLAPEQDYRYRIVGQHRQYFDSGLRFSADVGLISDRNFLEQYYEADWDNGPDLPTRLELYQPMDNQSFRLSALVNLNDFFMEGERLPQFDHTLLGQSVLNNWLTWHSHTQVGYNRVRPVTTPQDPADLMNFTFLPGEAAAQGQRLVTTQELDLPLQTGPVKVVPYALGQFAHWGEDLNGDQLNRTYWQAGVRTSLPMWNVYPEIRSQLFNLDGIAHKISLDTEASIAEANRDLNDIPRYTALDDNNVEHFRRRFPSLNFGGVLPPQFDERFFAVRSGMGGHVTNPAPEFVDDLRVMRVSLNQRWQTHRGRPGDRHVVDWITLNTHLSYFPEADRDNFGQDLGLAGYHFLWNVGDRLAVFSDGDFDIYDMGRRFVSVGTFVERPGIGRFSIAYKSLEGPFNTQAIDVGIDYRMSPKWHSHYFMFIDLGNGGNIVQNFHITRVGESFLLRMGFSFSESKDSLSYVFAIEPRALIPTTGPLAGMGLDHRRRFE